MAIDPAEFPDVSAAVRGDGRATKEIDEQIDAARAGNDFATIDEILAPVVGAATAGDEASLTFLLRCIDRHRLAQPPIRQILVDEGDVEDAAQTTLLAVSRAITSFEGRARFTTWLYRIAEREALQVIRKRKRVTDPEGQDLSGLGAQVRRISSVVAGADAIRQALDSLDDKFREPVIMCDVEGLEYSVIAEQLGLPLNTVKTRIRRGRQQVADIIMAQLEP